MILHPNLPGTILIYVCHPRTILLVPPFTPKSVWIIHHMVTLSIIIFYQLCSATHLVDVISISVLLLLKADQGLRPILTSGIRETPPCEANYLYPKLTVNLEKIHCKLIIK